MRKVTPIGRPPKLAELNPRTRSNIVVDDSTGCWIWQGARWYGYGPHLRLYQRYVGIPPKGHDLHHVCHNGKGGCCNPAHLEVLVEKVHITQHWEERVDQETVARIKRLLRTTWLTHPQIAESTGVAPTTVSAIATGQRWGVEGEVLAPPPRPCAHCGEPVIGRQRNAKFCSEAHRAAYNAVVRYRRKNPNAKHRATTSVPVGLHVVAFGQPGGGS